MSFPRRAALQLVWCLLSAIHGLGCSDGDDCQVVDIDTCSRGCVPVLSSSESFNQPCAIDGVFFGCVPGHDSSFWDSGDIESAQQGVCDLVRGENPGYIYCFEGRFNLYWYYRNIAMFCSGGGCDVEPVTSCPPAP